MKHGTSEDFNSKKGYTVWHIPFAHYYIERIIFRSPVAWCRVR